MALPVEHGWADCQEELISSQESLVEMSEIADACRSETSASDSLPDNSLWWVNTIKSHCSGFERPMPPKTPRTLLSACSASCAEAMVMKVMALGSRFVF